MIELERRVYSKKSTSDVLNVQQGLQCDQTLRNLIILTEPEEKHDIPLDVFIERTFKLQHAIDDRLTLAIIEGKLQQPSLEALRRGEKKLRERKEKILKMFEGKDVLDCSDFSNEEDEGLTALTANRLALAASLSDTPHILSTYSLSDASSMYFMPRQAEGFLEEAVALLPNRERLAGFGVNDVDHDTTVTLYFYDDTSNVTKKCVRLNEKERSIQELRKSKKIVIAVEGDIAGHAIRALETARGLKRLGYEPDVMGSGYYMQPFEEEGFSLLPLPNMVQNVERERIIARARGGGHGGISFWDYKTVKERARQYEDVLERYLEGGIDLFLSDMNPIADIAAQHVQQRRRGIFPTLTQTHDIRLFPERTLRTLKLKGISIGEIIHAIHASPLVQALDPNGRRFMFSHFMLNEVADIIMGLPLSTFDHLYRVKHHGVPVRNADVKFTDYLYGRDGTLVFDFASETDTDKRYIVGLQAERGKVRNEQDPLTTKMSQGDSFVLNAQGSTYHERAWDIVEEAVTTLAHCFCVHATGRREDQPTPIYDRAENEDRRTIGYKVGYVGTYNLSRNADLLIHHGGHGTISQWLVATADRMNSEKNALKLMLQSASDEEIREYVGRSKGVSRSIAVCNTFEQENNALALNETGGDNVCTVITGDNLVNSSHSLEQVRGLAVKKLTDPLDNKERKFWIDTVRATSTMDASLHAALLLERVMLKQSRGNGRPEKKELAEQPNPYLAIPSIKRSVLSILEIPTAFVSVANKVRSKDIMGYDQVQRLLERALDVIGTDFADTLAHSPRVESLISKGFEALVYTFSQDGRKWVIKVGLPSGLPAGMYSPTTDEYANLMEWNRAVLQKTFTSELPYLLPSPYFIVSPKDMHHPTTIQIAPFIEQAKSLTAADKQRLIWERRQFDRLSHKLKREKNAVPDLVNSGNLKIGMVNGEPHLVLFDMGLHNLQAPTPLLNRLASPAHKVSLIRDIFELQKSK